jgi:ABC-type glycerol-3-phosphate transport system substrate-binding protein
MKNTICAMLVGVAACLFSACVESAPTKVGLRFAAWGNAQETAGYRAMVKQFTDNDQELGVDTEYMPQAAYWEKLGITIQTGDAPDVFVIDSAHALSWVASRRLQAMDSLAAGKAFPAYAPRLKAAVSHDGQSFGVPLTVGLKVLACNRQSFAKAGLALPSATKPLSWPEFTELLAKLAGAANAKQALAMPLDLLVQDLLGAYRTSLFDDPASQARKGFDPERGLAAFALLRRLIDLNSANDASPLAKFRDGSVAIAYLSIDELKSLTRDGPDFVTVPLPQGDVRYVVADINYLVIPAFSKHKAEAWKLINALVNGEQAYPALGGNLPANPDSFGRPDPDFGPTTTFDTITSEGAFIAMPLTIGNQVLAAKYESVIGDFSSGLVSANEASSAIDEAVQASLLASGGSQ